MANSTVNFGSLVALSELKPSSPYYEDGLSLRVTGRLEEYSVESAVALIAHEDTRLRIDTRHLRGCRLRSGSIFQFIGELIVSDNDAILHARVGRNVDGIDLSLYHQTMILLRKFQSDCVTSSIPS